MQIKDFKEYTKKEIERRLALRFGSSMVTKMTLSAREHAGKVVFLDGFNANDIIGLKYEMDGGKMRWFLLE